MPRRGWGEGALSRPRLSGLRSRAPPRPPRPPRSGASAEATGRGPAASAEPARGASSAWAEAAPAATVSAAVLAVALGGDPAGCLATAGCAAGGYLLGQRTALGRALTGPVCAMVAGVLAASCGVPGVPTGPALGPQLRFIHIHKLIV